MDTCTFQVQINVKQPKELTLTKFVWASLTVNWVSTPVTTRYLHYIELILTVSCWIRLLLHTKQEVIIQTHNYLTAPLTHIQLPLNLIIDNCLEIFTGVEAMLG